MADLLSDEVFRAYMRKRPRLPEGAQFGEPWRILAQRVTDDDKPRWALANVSTYDEAYRRMQKMLAKPNKWADVTIISKRRFYSPPQGFEWDPKFDWCGRCRRPTIFKVMWRRHPALRDAPVVQYSDDLHRCTFCGVRQGFGPTFEMRF
jgi:hypothetical protein